MHKRKKDTVYNNASELNNDYLEIYFNQYVACSDAEKESWVIKIIVLFDFLLMHMITALKMKN